MLVSELMAALADGAQRETLALVYPDAEGAADRLSTLAREFMARWGDLPGAGIFSAPGRTELGGNHTDHQGGRVLAAAVDLDMAGVAAPLPGGEVRVLSRGFGETALTFGDTEPRAEERGTTAALIRGVCAQFSAMGLTEGGFAAVTDSRVAPGSGLSSSAAFEVLIANMVNGLFCGGEVDDGTLAFFGQCAENAFFGKPSGLMDQLASSVGGVAALDFAKADEPMVERVDYDFSGCGHALVLIDSGADHADLTADYALIPQEMCAIACEMGHELLSQCDPLEFYATAPILREKYGERPVLRALHFFDETRRAAEETAALKRGDFPAFLELVRQSGESSEHNLQNVVSPREPKQLLKKAIDTARELLCGCGAVRVHGGGFAGTAQAWVPLEELAGFERGMGKAGFRTFRARIRPVGGIRLL